MKYIIATAVVLILIGLPLVSYFYLKKGFDFRYNALIELEKKGDFPDFIISDEENQSTHKFLKGKISQVYFSKAIPNPKADQFLTRIDKQLNNREYFQIIQFAEIVTPLDSLPRANPWPTFPIAIEQFEALNLEADKVYLVDTTAAIRHMYDITEEEMKKLVSHTVVLLPIPKKKEIKLNRDIDGE